MEEHARNFLGPLEIYKKHINIDVNIYKTMDNEEFSDIVENYKQDDEWL